jgi:hypothetical protein
MRGGKRKKERKEGKKELQGGAASCERQKEGRIIL